MGYFGRAVDCDFQRGLAPKLCYWQYLSVFGVCLSRWQNEDSKWDLVFWVCTKMCLLWPRNKNQTKLVFFSRWWSSNMNDLSYGGNNDGIKWAHWCGAHDFVIYFFSSWSKIRKTALPANGDFESETGQKCVNIWIESLRRSLNGAGAEGWERIQNGFLTPSKWRGPAPNHYYLVETNLQWIGSEREVWLDCCRTIAVSSPSQQRPVRTRRFWLAANSKSCLT